MSINVGVLTDIEKAEKRRKQRAEATARYQLKHPDRVKVSQKNTYKKRGRSKALEDRYGLTVQEYDELLLRQNGHCALCPATTFMPDREERLAVDHDHVSKKVRGLLCQACNLMLGYAKDLPERLEEGASYLRRHNNEGVVQMASGVVKWFNDAKGFGFITQDGGGGDVFVHHTQIQMDGFKTLSEGQSVEFDVTKGPKGLSAANVRAV